MTTGRSVPGPQPVRPYNDNLNGNGTGPQGEGECPRTTPSAKSDVPLAPTEELDEANRGEVIEIRDEEAVGEAEPMRMAPDPGQPTAAESEEHRVTHYPYRNWCRECVEGRALGEQRGRRGMSNDGRTDSPSLP